MPDKPDRPEAAHSNDAHPTPGHEQDEKELIEKLPEQTNPAQEWGERLETGKDIAGGKKQP